MREKVMLLIKLLPLTYWHIKSYGGFSHHPGYGFPDLMGSVFIYKSKQNKIKFTSSKPMLTMISACVTVLLANFWWFSNPPANSTNETVDISKNSLKIMSYWNFLWEYCLSLNPRNRKNNLSTLDHFDQS